MVFRSPAILLAGIVVGVLHNFAAAAGGQLKLTVVEKETGKPLAARMHLKNGAGRMPRIPKLPVFADHFVFDGEVTLKLPKGQYRFELECGPEFLDQQGHFEIQEFADDEKTIEMRRFVNMAKESWYSGDLDVERPVSEIELLMRADDLHIAHLFPLPKPLKKDILQPGTQVFDRNRCFRPAEELPVWKDLKQVTAWDLPLRVALQQVDSVELAAANLQRNNVVGGEKGCKPRDPTFYPGNEGLARWQEAVYFHLLNCGLRIPPSAGSGSGQVQNPVGYNRVYAHVEGEFSHESWLDALKAGRSIVTNGPMIRPTVEGEFPGFVFQTDAGQQLELEVALNLATRDKISYLDIVKDGRVYRSIRLEEFKNSGGRLPLVKFDKSGWFLLRVVADNAKTHRFAMTAPYYVEAGYERRISKSSVQFFLDWIDERTKMLAGKDAELGEWQAAREFWQKLLEKANAE
jgi:hypothetical protein